MKVPEISFYVKADFSECTKSQHDRKVGFNVGD